jgi:Tfp pilus assembly protein PilO
LSEEGKGGIEMWKETIICMIIVIVIIVGNVITQNYTLESVKELTDELEELKEDFLKIEQGEKDNEDAKEKMKEIKENWDTRHNNLAYYIEHDELEKVETDLTAVNSFIEQEEYAEAISELDKSVFILKHIKEKYEFNLQNIF